MKLGKLKKMIQHRTVKNLLPYVVLALFLLVFGLSVNQWGVYQANRGIVAAVFASLSAIWAFACVILTVFVIKKKVNYKVLVYSIMVGGLIVRLAYICYTSVYDRQYDVWYIKQPGEKTNFFLHHGHLQYIYNIFSTGALPDSNLYQFYHPPLWHFSSAMVLKLYTGLGYSLDYALENIQTLSVFCSQAVVIIFYHLLNDLKIKPKYVITAMLIASFCPIFIVMGGTVNNDIMMCMFFMATLTYLVRWWRFGRMGDILRMALFLGLGMMTKTSCVLIAPVIAVAFLIRLIQSIVAKVKKKDSEIGERKINSISQYICQFCAFGAVSIPLGIWYQIRNLVLFNQPLNYVMRFKNNSPLYCGDTRFLNRLFSFPAQEMYSKLFCRSSKDYSVLPYLLKTSAFEEHHFDTIIEAGWVLFYAVLFLAIVSTLCMGVVLLASIVRKAQAKPVKGTSLANCMRGYKWLLFSTWAILLFGYLSFCLKYPFTCTMDARYVSPTILICVLFMTMANEWLDDRSRRLGNVLYCSVSFAGVVYALSTIVFYVGIK